MEDQTFSPFIMALSHFTIQHATDAILWIASTGEICHANQEACDRLEYSYEEITSMNILEINRVHNSESMRERFEKNRELGHQIFESTHFTRSGKEIPVEIAMNHITFEGRDYSCSIVRDITERKQKEAALRGAFTEIQELKERLQEENVYLQHEVKLAHNFGEIISKSKAFRQILKQVEQVAPTDSSVLISGESGTGKELIARSLHRLSRRNNRAMIKVNCAALPAHLIESELFGHERGAFTGAISRKKGRFELADQGTLFLDEIGEMPLELQPKLLRALQEGEFERLGGNETLKVDVRIIAATNRNLQKQVLAGEFREDLFYRLNVFPIHCLPLRERKEDIPLLVRYFCDKFTHRLGKKITSISQQTMDRLQTYYYPGNIRELENIVERAMIVSQEGKLEIHNWLPDTPTQHKDEEELLNLDEVQRQYIIKILQLKNWRVSGEKGAAQVLGLKPTTLEARMKKLNIKRSVNAK